jgi:wyosine [tRNA(Phe)-imidazoG37] synthetase (radical SAM superfamily)
VEHTLEDHLPYESDFIMNRYVFGPVLSRRLGRSLGIDLLPHKTCSYNCVYCECGATTNLTITRKEFFPPWEIIAELDHVLEKKPSLDYITFAGSGEPTLSLSLGQIIRHLKETYPWYHVAVLTNGTLCILPEVRKELLLADLIIPTVPAADQKIQDQIFRPYPNISVSSTISGLVALRKEFSGQIWVEVFLVPGINTTNKELEDTCKTISLIRPDLIQLNSLDRPGTESWVQTVEWIDIERIRDYLIKTGIPVDIVGYEQCRSFSSLAHVH